MKKYIKYIVSILCVSLVGVMFLYNNVSGVTDVVLLKYEPGTKSATSSVGGFITAGTGTTTYAWRSDSLTDDTLYLHLRASTTATLLMAVEYSLGSSTEETAIDCISVPTACDWYAEAAVPAQGIGDAYVVHASTTLLHSFGFGSEASTTKIVMSLSPLDAMYRRVRMYMPAGSNNATVRLQAVHKITNY